MGAVALAPFLPAITYSIDIVVETSGTEGFCFIRRNFL